MPLIDQAYQRHVGRTPEPEGRAHWQGQMDQGMTPYQLMLGVSQQPEAQVHSAYDMLLGRRPEPQGQQFWQSYLGMNSPAQMYQAIQSTPEGQDHFYGAGRLQAGRMGVQSINNMPFVFGGYNPVGALPGNIFPQQHAGRQIQANLPPHPWVEPWQDPAAEAGKDDKPKTPTRGGGGPEQEMEAGPRGYHYWERP